MDRIALCLRVLSERTPLMFDIFNKMCRQSLDAMLMAKVAEEKEFQKVGISHLTYSGQKQVYTLLYQILNHACVILTTLSLERIPNLAMSKRISNRKHLKNHPS